MEQKENAIIIDGKKYEYRETKYPTGRETCENCALHEQCAKLEDSVLCDAFDIADNNTWNFQIAGDNVQTGDDCLTSDKVYDFYQERSVKAGERADQLAWMFIVMMTGGLISGHAFQTFSVCAALSVLYLLLSVMQAVWQTFTSWIFMRQIERTDIKPSDYPSWVGGGAWLFFWLKKITIATAVCYFVHAIFE
jgi:hypothetical protein